MEPIIETVDLSCVYSIGTPFEHKALDRVNFTAYPGEYIGIIGHTGSGKSTLIKAIANEYSIKAGTITMDGYDHVYQKRLFADGIKPFQQRDLCRILSRDAWSHPCTDRQLYDE